MKSGDLDGRGRMYDRDGVVILENDEKLLFYIVNVRDCLTIPTIGRPVFHKVKKLPSGITVKEKISGKRYDKAIKKREKILSTWDIYAKSQIAKVSKRLKYTWDSIPGKLYVTNKRFIFVRKPYPSTYLVHEPSASSSGEYAYENMLTEEGAMQYFVFHHFDWDMVYIGDCGINFAKKGISNGYYHYDSELLASDYWWNQIVVRRYKGKIKPIHRSERFKDPSELGIGFYSFRNLFHQKKFTEHLLKVYQDAQFTERGYIRWQNLMKLFMYEDVEGLDKVYDKNCAPILDKDEKIISQKKTIPIVTIRAPYRVRFPRPWYDVLNPKQGILYRTNKRIIFIRKIYDDDLQYREFPEGTHMSFCFSPKDTTKYKITKKGEIYEIKVDKRNWLRVVIPKYPEASLKIHEYKQRFLVPFGTEEWDEGRAEMNWVERNEDYFVFFSRIPVFLGVMFGVVGTIHALYSGYYSFVREFFIPWFVPSIAILSSFFFFMPQIFKKIKEWQIFRRCLR